MTDHGAVISIGDSSFMVDGKAVHLDGMTHFCPKCKVQSKAIASNQGFMVVGSRSIVAVGDKSTCGSKYLKISDLAVMSKGFGNTHTLSENTNNFIPTSKNQYGQRFLLQDELTGEPLSNICYEIEKNGEVIHGKSDESGYTELITSNQAEEIQIHIIYEEHDHE
jgi:uncharacterized Zn-binding protein involved in type VI secretion